MTKDRNKPDGNWTGMARSALMQAYEPMLAKLERYQADSSMDVCPFVMQWGKGLIPANGTALHTYWLSGATCCAGADAAHRATEHGAGADGAGADGVYRAADQEADAYAAHGATEYGAGADTAGAYGMHSAADYGEGWDTAHLAAAYGAGAANTADAGAGTGAGAYSCEQKKDRILNQTVRPRLLFCGRATNGWLTSCLDPEALFDTEYGPDCIFNLPSQITWVEKDMRSNCKRSAGNYRCNSSPFWRVISATAGHFYSAPDPDDGLTWSHHTGWTNLYKAAPMSGNPPPGMKSLIFADCLQILKCELDLLSPTHLIMLAGSSWYEPFVKGLIKCWHPGSNLNDHFAAVELWDSYSAHAWQVQIPGKSHLLTIIGSEHPQRKAELPHIKALTSLIATTMTQAPE